MISRLRDVALGDCHRSLTVAASLALTAITAPVAYEAVFTVFYPFDDEGYLLVSLDSYLREGGLYEEVFSQYGPFYYEFWGGLFEVFGLNVTHDTGRLLTLGVWLAVSVLCAAPVYTITRSLLLTVASQLGVFIPLYFLLGGPMHPAGLVSLLLGCIVAWAALVHPRWPRLGLFGLGALGAALALTKINVGGLALIALGAAFLSGAELAGRWRTAGPVLVALAAATTPFVIVGEDLGSGWARLLAVHVALAAVAVVAAGARGGTSPGVRVREGLWLVWGAVAAGAAVLAAAMLTGSSPRSLVDGILVRPLGLSDAFSAAFVLPRWTIAWDIICLGLLVAVLAYRRTRARPPGWLDSLLALGRVVAGVVIGVVVLSPEVASERAYALALPLAWLPLIAPIQEEAGVRQLARPLLPLLAVLTALQVFPVPQATWKFLLVPLAAICVADGFASLGSARTTAGLLARWAGHVATLVLAGLTFHLAVLRDAVDATDAAYAGGVAPRAKGTDRLRLPSRQAAELSAITLAVRLDCSQLVTLPGMNSFYLLAMRAPPTDLNATAWMYLLDSDEQLQIVRTVRDERGACVLRNQPLLDFWSRGRPIPERPLVRFIGDRFRTVRRIGDYELMFRRDRGGGRGE